MTRNLGGGSAAAGAAAVGSFAIKMYAHYTLYSIAWYSRSRP